MREISIRVEQREKLTKGRHNMRSSIPVKRVCPGTASQLSYCIVLCNKSDSQTDSDFTCCKITKGLARQEITSLFIAGYSISNGRMDQYFDCFDQVVLTCVILYKYQWHSVSQ